MIPNGKMRVPYQNPESNAKVMERRQDEHRKSYAQVVVEAQDYREARRMKSE